MGFSRIMSQPDGAAIYGIWHCILGACSQQLQRAGWLTSDGHQTGTAWAPDDLSIKFRRPIEEIERALEVLCSEKVGWILKHECPPTARQLPANCQTGALEGKGIEEKGRGGNPPIENSNAVNGTRHQWQIEKDVLRLEKLRRSIRTNRGQSWDADAGMWRGPALTSEEKAEWDKIGRDIESWKQEMKTAPP